MSIIKVGMKAEVVLTDPDSQEPCREKVKILELPNDNGGFWVVRNENGVALVFRDFEEMTILDLCKEDGEDEEDDQS